ncbi:MAG: FAD-binding oxidoreductase [Dehalococcoidia bacterium]|nr:FAD-binding oxidoreductase [Dehalococcoidia bacterium]
MSRKEIHPLRKEVEGLLGLLSDRATVDPFELVLYQYDLAAVPPVLSGLLFRTLPDVVVRPRSMEEVSSVLRYATLHHLPVTPRAAASTAYYDAVPARGGVLLDLNGLRGILDVDKERATVTVLAATRWKELDDELRYKWGLAVRSYPTSAPSSTVGGWFNMEGWGVGSLQYGCMHQQVLRAEAVLPGGKVVELTPNSNPPLSWFAGLEGTLGVITSLELGLRPAPEVESHRLIAFADFARLQKAAARIACLDPKPYHLHFADSTFTRSIERAGFETELPEDMHLLSVHYEGSRAEVEAAEAPIAGVVQETGGKELERLLAHEEWRNRFSEVRAKRAGPSLLGAETLLPLRSLASYIESISDLGRRLGLPIYTYGAVVSPEWCQPNSFFPTNERRALGYLTALSVTKALQDRAARLGGRPNGVGVWNTPYLGRVWGSRERRERLRRKAHLDPHGVMNPGKLYGAPLLLREPFFALGMGALALLRRLARAGGEGSRTI